MTTIREVREIPLDKLVIGKGQVRLSGVSKGIDELAESIAKLGLLEPIVVCPAKKEGHYEILTGQRRFLAHKQLDKKTIRAAILEEEVDETMAKVISVTENLVRRDLDSKDLITVSVPNLLNPVRTSSFTTIRTSVGLATYIRKIKV